jgi:hypothetical protein
LFPHHFRRDTQPQTPPAAHMGIFSGKKFSTKTSVKEGGGGGGGKTYTPVAPGATAPDDDVATIFTTFSVLYYGFFGLTLLVFPWVHAMPSVNPLSYWTSIDDSLAFAFRLAGGAFLTIVLGPFLDEIFGGIGVQMKAFTRQVTIFNLIGFFLFEYYAFYDPLTNAVPFMWKAQAVIAAVILGWNIFEAVPDALLADSYVLFNTLLYSGFGFSLAAAPSLFFGPPSPVAYWTQWADVDLFCGRSLGLTLICLITTGYFLTSGSAGFAKMLTAFNAINTGLFCLPVFLGGASAVESMWSIQLVLSIPILMVGLYLEITGLTGSWSLSIACPKWGPNPETFNMINLIWYLPFVLGFAYDPNMLFGASAITGMPMFTITFGETAIWFGRAWGAGILMLILAPYVFSFPAAKVSKMMTLSYVLFLGLFGYGYFATSMFNVTIMLPLMAVNFLLTIFGIYVCLPGQAGEPML